MPSFDDFLEPLLPPDASLTPSGHNWFGTAGKARMWAPAGRVVTRRTNPQEYKSLTERSRSMSKIGYPENQTFWITVIEDPLIPLDQAQQKPPRFVLAPKPFLAPSLEIAFMMAARDSSFDTTADLQRCRVRVGEG